LHDICFPFILFNKFYVGIDFYYKLILLGTVIFFVLLFFRYYYLTLYFFKIWPCGFFKFLSIELSRPHDLEHAINMLWTYLMFRWRVLCGSSTLSRTIFFKIYLLLLLYFFIILLNQSRSQLSNFFYFF
jgi:hypothetical protein